MENEGTGVSFAVTVARGENAWQVRSFRDEFTDPQVAVDAVRNLRSEGAAFAMLCVDDDYFVIVRPHPARDMFLLSDATMAVDDDFAATSSTWSRRRSPTWIRKSSTRSTGGRTATSRCSRTWA